MLYRKSFRGRNIKKHATSNIPWKELERYRKCRPQGPPLPPTCSHRHRKFGCSSLDLEEVEAFHRRLYFSRDRASQDAFILRHCQGRSPLARASSTVLKKRRITADYFVPVRGAKVQVCKVAFMNILRVNRSRVDTVVRRSKSSSSSSSGLMSCQSSLSSSVQWRSLPTIGRSSTESKVHRENGSRKSWRKHNRHSIFSRLCTMAKPNQRTAGKSSSYNEDEIHLYKTKKVKRSTMFTLKRKSFRRKQSSVTNQNEKNVDNSPYVPKVIDEIGCKAPDNETRCLSSQEMDTCDFIDTKNNDGNVSSEKQKIFCDDENLIELKKDILTQDHTNTILPSKEVETELSFNETPHSKVLEIDNNSINAQIDYRDISCDEVIKKQLSFHDTVNFTDFQKNEYLSKHNFPDTGHPMENIKTETMVSSEGTWQDNKKQERDKDSSNEAKENDKENSTEKQLRFRDSVNFIEFYNNVLPQEDFPATRRLKENHESEIPKAYSKETNHLTKVPEIDDCGDVDPKNDNVYIYPENNTEKQLGFRETVNVIEFHNDKILFKENSEGTGHTMDNIRTEIPKAPAEETSHLTDFLEIDCYNSLNATKNNIDTSPGKIIGKQLRFRDTINVMEYNSIELLPQENLEGAGNPTDTSIASDIKCILTKVKYKDIDDYNCTCTSKCNGDTSPEKVTEKENLIKFHNKEVLFPENTVPSKLSSEETSHQAEAQETVCDKSKVTAQHNVDIPREKVTEKQLRFRDTVTLVEENNKILPQENVLNNTYTIEDEIKPSVISGGQLDQKCPQDKLGQTGNWDWLDPGLKPQRSRTFDWSPIKRPASVLRDCVLSTDQTKCAGMKCPETPLEANPNSTVYESKKRKLTKLRRAVEEQENFTPGKTKLNKNDGKAVTKHRAVPILGKRNFETKSLKTKAFIKSELKTRFPLQTIQYLKNHKTIIGKPWLI